jgi:predicted amidohydrolase
MSPGQGRILAVAQPFRRDLDAALAQVERVLERARAKNAGLVVFPECALGGYIREPLPSETAPDLPRALDPDGPEIARLIRLAGDLVVCIGYTEAGAHSPYSAAVCVSGDGVLGRHRKVHLPPSERFAYAAGDRFEAFDTPVGRLGMLLCYDKLFPEAATALAVDGAETIACMAAWPADRHRPAARIADDRQTRHFDVVDQARAVENQVVWVSANGTGRWGPLHFLGRSKVVDPDGVVLASTGARAGTAFATVDHGAAIGAVKRSIDHIADRKPLAYRAGPHISPNTGTLSA